MDDTMSYVLVDGVGNEVFLASGVIVLFSVLCYYLIRKMTVPFQMETGLFQIGTGQEEEERRPRYGMEIDRCPICFDARQSAVETNCGHVFCAACLVTYWGHHRNGRACIRCPVCRQRVTLILPLDRFASRSGEPYGRIWEYNDLYSGQPRPPVSHVRDLPMLLRHMFGSFFTDGGLMMLFRVRIVLLCVGAFLYLLSPLDLLPEAFFGLFGLVDDVLVILSIAVHLTGAYRTYMLNRER